LRLVSFQVDVGSDKQVRSRQLFCDFEGRSQLITGFEGRSQRLCGDFKIVLVLESLYCAEFAE
jgi:hypothetical protein